MPNRSASEDSPIEGMPAAYTVADYLRVKALEHRFDSLENLIRESIKASKEFAAEAHTERLKVIAMIDEKYQSAVALIGVERTRIDQMEVQDRRWAVMTATATAVVSGLFAAFWMLLQVWEKIKALFWPPPPHH